MTSKIDSILSFYSHENPKVIANLRRILESGSLQKTGKMLILPVDQGMEHGSDKSFLPNPDAFDPLYHVELAIEGGFSAYASSLGMLRAIPKSYSEKIPLILKVNHSISLGSSNCEPNQIAVASVKDALELNCCAVGVTIYPGSDHSKSMVEFAANLIQQARDVGLPTVVWAYPRGRGISNPRSLNTVNYAAHIACSIGAHIVKVKLPNKFKFNRFEGYWLIEDDPKNAEYNMLDVDGYNGELVVSCVMKAAFNSKRIVLFSGGEMRYNQEIIEEACNIAKGGGHGSIIGRNIFQRNKEDALQLINSLIYVYKWYS